MSRIANMPVTMPKGVELQVNDGTITVKGPKGTLSMAMVPQVEIERDGDELKFVPERPDAVKMAGTARSLVNNMVIGVTDGFERKLELHGVGYRAAMQGAALNLTLGFSHPVLYQPPAGITIETPAQNEVLVKGTDKQVVGQVAAEIRAKRPPEPYKGKGVRYAGEHIIIKEAKKA